MFSYERWDILHAAVTCHSCESAEPQKNRGHTSNECLLMDPQAPWDVIWSKSGVFLIAH